MSHFARQPRPLTRPGQLPDLATLLRALAGELDREDALHTQRGLAAAIDNGYPASASGAGGGGGHGGAGSPVESALIASDRIADHSRELVLRLNRVAADVLFVLPGLEGWRRDRSFNLCAEGHILPQGAIRCPHVDADGAQCATRAGSERRCSVCDEVQAPGQPLRKGLCDGCRKSKGRAMASGRPWFRASELALAGNMLTEEGTSHHG